MKMEDVMKKMTAVKTAVEKNYPGVKADVQLNDWQKGGYHRLYINLVVTGGVNGKTVRESASFGFLNLKTNRYSANGAYDMRHFDGTLTWARIISQYAKAYENAGTDNKKYTARPGFTDVLNVKLGQRLSKKEMLDKSWAMLIAPEELDTYWDEIHGVPAQATEKSAKVTEKKDSEIGRYDGHTVTISPSTDKYVVKDDGKYTGDYGRDHDDGLYEAAMYLYDKMSEGHTITVLSDDAWDYIVENAIGLKVSIDTNPEARTIKRGE